MKNFFKYFLIIFPLAFPTITQAGVTSIAENPDIRPLDPNTRLNEMKKLYNEFPDLSNPSAVKKYLQERLKIVTQAQIESKDLSTPSATSIIDANAQQKAKEADTLSAYEKIYQESMRQAGSADETINQDVELQGTFYRLKEQQQEAKPFVPDFPYVTVKLSDKREILAPADEHFPYILTTIRIEPTGLLQVTEEFTFISNNESFPYGFYRILPKYNYSRNGEKRRTDITLESVIINGEEYPYKMTEIGNYLHIEPEENLNLPTGIYTYRFNYIIDRAVWYYDNFDELYWDITAKTLKNVVGSANAVVYLPDNKTFIAQNAIASTKEGLDRERVTITTLTTNALGFADTQALGVGEDVHLFLTMEKGTLLPPDFSKKYQWFIHDYGANLFALFALLAILLSYRISFEQIRRNKDKTRAYLKKTPANYRMLNLNIYDKTSLGAEILNLCAKNILELREDGDKTLLIKKSDNLKKLSKPEQKLMSLLYPGQETVLNNKPESSLKLKRAYTYLKYSTYKQLHLFKLKLNALYLLFSIGMLLCGIIGGALLSVNPWNSFGILSTFTLLLFPYMAIFINITPKKKIWNYVLKTFLVLGLFWTASILSIYSSGFYAIIQMLTVYLIIYYYKMFSRRSGLLRNKIKETEDYKSYLQKNPELEKNSKDFINKKAYIYAFDLENRYPDIADFNNINKLLQALTSN